MTCFQKGRNDNYPQQYYNDYRRRILHNDRINNFEIKDYDRSLSYNRNDYNKDTNIHKETQTTSRQQRHDYDPYQIDEQTFHRRRNFTNSQYQQQDNILKFNNNQRRLDNNEYRNYGGKNQQQNRVFKRYELHENKNNLPPRLQINNNYRNLTQKQQYQRKLKIFKNLFMYFSSI
jgi:hypothetical protein